MNTTYCEHWPTIKERFKAWWNREKTGTPLMKVIAEGKPAEHLEETEEPLSPREFYLDVSNIVTGYRNFCKTHYFLGDVYPSLRLDLGAGSMALYMGGEPEFAWDTIWFKEFVHNWETAELTISAENPWFKKHLEMKQYAKDLARGDFLINIPDIGENLDILAAMRGPQNLCYDLMDVPELLKKQIAIIDAAYPAFYNPMYEIAKDEEGGVSYTAFEIWGLGKTAKIGCDFAALISPEQFKEFVVPSVRKQCQFLDNSLFHLDGPAAIKHMDYLMEVEEIDVFQWTPGAGNDDGGSEQWFPLYDKARAVEKQLWVWLYEGELRNWIDSAARLVKRYGPDCLYIRFPIFSDLNTAQAVIESAKNGFS